MMKALNTLKVNYDYTDYPELDNFQIETTHYYLKFKPQNEEQEGLLKKDSTLHLFNYRLDCEYNEDFLKNRIPTLDSIPDYYTSIKAGNAIPNVPYDIIEELYIPEQETFFEDIIDIEEYRVGGKIDNKTDLFNLLLWEAYSYTGNEKELETENSTEAQRWIFGKKWYPSGIVAVHDDIVGTVVPVSGAQILMRQWFTVRNAITWANGAFTTGFVRGYARYIIQWERYHYSIRNGAFFQAETRGPEVRNQPWLVPIFGGDNKYHAHIHQAAHDYYYGTRFGLVSPSRNGTFRLQTKIAARETAPFGVPSSFSHIRSEITFGLSAQIHIKAWGKPSYQVYGTTIHELAHSAHHQLDNLTYDNLVQNSFLNPIAPTRDKCRRLLETWPTTVETYMTLVRYTNTLNISGFNYIQDNFQLRTIAANKDYTSGGIDMIDNINQRIINNDFNLPVDNVSGYNLRELEIGLIGAPNWFHWRDNIKSRFNNPTETNLDELFNNWN